MRKGLFLSTVVFLSFIFFCPLSFAGQKIYDLNKGIWDIMATGSLEPLGIVEAIGDVNGDGIKDLILSAKRVLSPPAVGAVFVFYGRPNFPASYTPSLYQDADIIIKGCCDSFSGNNEEFGYALAAGDINGDGNDDIVIGSPVVFQGSTNSNSKVYVVYGNKNFPPNHFMDLSTQAADITFIGKNLTNGNSDGLGYALVVADVLYNDGYADLILGAPWTEGDPGSFDFRGTAYIIPGYDNLPAVINVSNQNKFLPENAGDRLGSQIAVGDIDGDGLLGVILSAPLFDRDQTTPDVGKVYVIEGSDWWGYPNPYINSIADVSILGKDANGMLGTSLASGDINGDAIDDIIFSQLPGVLANGYIFYGGALASNIDLSTTTPDITLKLNLSPDAMGLQPPMYLHNFGTVDFNADSIDDLIVGISFFDQLNPPDSQLDKVFVFYGASSGLSGTLTSKNANIVVLAENIGDGLGSSVVGGDINADGKEDLIIGAPGAGVGQGKIYVLNNKPQVQILSVVPNKGTVQGGTTVTVKGTNFTNQAPLVNFGKNPAANINVLDPNTLTCDTPPYTPPGTGGSFGGSSGDLTWQGRGYKLPVVDVTVSSGTGPNDSDTCKSCFTYTQK